MKEWKDCCCMIHICGYEQIYDRDINTHLAYTVKHQELKDES